MSSSKRSRRSDSHLSYSKIHVPKMKSVFWKYFGFPADENDEIITKQKVICTLCNAVLTNHSNTTNIRAHIQSTHKAIFAELISKHGIYVPPRRTQKKTRPRSEMINCEETLTAKEHRRSIKREQLNDSSSSALIEEDSIHLLDAIPLTYEDTDRISKDEELSDIGSVNNFLVQKNDSSTPSSPKVKIVSRPYDITVDINPIQMPVEHNIKDAIVKLVIKDIQNVSSIYSSGMEEFINSLFSNQILPSLFNMESSLKNLHNEKFAKLKDRLKVHSHMKSFSLSFDVWTNVENKQFVSIYFNNISEEVENQFRDNLYMTVELNDYTMFDQIFEEFNLVHCSAAVINCNNKILNTFLSSNDIPIVYCFSYIVNNCINDVCRIPEVSSVLEEVRDVIERYASQICSEDVDVPTTCKDFPLTNLTVLKFFCDSVSWPDEQDLLISKAKQVLDAVAPLEVTLDTLKEEEIPLSSLFLPFAEKIMEKHFILSEHDDITVQAIKTTVAREFKRSVCSNNHLTVSAMLDPRFHKFLSVKHVGICVNTLEKKYLQLSKQSGFMQKSEPVKEDAQKSTKKSHLKMFFDCLDTPTIKHAQDETCVENDLRRYREEAFASLEESPLLWWNQWGNMYGCLRYLADSYNCTLGFVNLSLKNPLKDQISFHRKRFMLTGKLIDQILFLNKHY